MRLYVFITIDITAIGGTQVYIANKAEYLERNGWKVLVLYSSYYDRPCVIPALNKYRDGKVQGINVPPFKWPHRLYGQILRKASQQLEEYAESVEIIIETHSDLFSAWGEILACRYNAKHITVLMNEIYHGKNKYYDDLFDFYIFKYRRREIGGGALFFKELFGDRIDLSGCEECIFSIYENPVADVQFNDAEHLVKKDWNICLISRPEKEYVPKALEGVFTFATDYPNKRIQLVLVGDKAGYDRLIKSFAHIPDNLTITLMGTLVPLPRELFGGYIDIFIAGAGSGLAAAREGATVIVPDPYGLLANGLLGYDTSSAHYRQPGCIQESYEESLRRALVERVQDRKEFSLACDDVESCTKQNLHFITNSDSSKEYYDTELLTSIPGKMDFKRIASYFLAQHFPSFMNQVVQRILKS